MNLILSKRPDFLSYIILLFAFFSFLPNKIKGLPVILLLIYSIFTFLNSKNRKIKIKKLFFLSSLFFLVLISTLLYNNLTSEINRVIKMISLITIPISFSLLDNSLNVEYIKKLKNYIFLNIISSFFYSLYIIISFLKNFNSPHSKLYSGFILKDDFDLLGINQHPIYMSIFLSISLILIFLDFFLKKTIFTNKKILLSVISLPILIAILLLARKGVIIASAISIFTAFIVRIKNKKTLIITLITSSALIYSLFLIPSINKRFAEVFKKNTYTKLNMANSTSIRVAIYTCCIDKIKQSPILGYGYGNVKNELKQCYSEKNYPFKKTYNSHNQYLDFYLNFGIVGFIVLISFIYLNFRYGIIQNNIYLCCFIIYFGILMLFENIISRQSGIILFSFLITLFNFLNLETNNLIAND